MLDQVPDPSKAENFGTDVKSIDDYMYEERAKMYTLAFEQQFHTAVYYAYLKLKEQEIRNISYLADLVSLNAPKNLHAWKKIIIPFKDVY